LNALTIGIFDGIHAGHRRLIRHTIKKRFSKGQAVMLTFRYPPEYYFNPRDFEGLLYRPEEKERRARALGIDRVEALDFPTLKDMTPSEFVDRILGPLDPSWVIVGYNFRFGRHRTGTTDFLRAYGKKKGFQTMVVPPVFVNGIKVSSTIIRYFLKNGEILKANAFLNQPYLLEGTLARSSNGTVLPSLFSLRFTRTGSGYVPLHPGYYLARNRHLGHALFLASSRTQRNEPPDFSVHLLGFDRNNPRFVETVDSKTPYDWILLDYLSPRLDRAVLEAARGRGHEAVGSR